VLKKIGRALTDPHRLLYETRARLGRGSLMQRYRQLAERGGFRALYLVLSFDCDTREDAEAALSVQEKLARLEVPAVFAVPGVLLTKSPDIYRQIASAGGEFINHGFHDHTHFDKTLGRYVSIWFYNDLPFDRIRTDIIEGDRAIRETLGVTPMGFRAPHFGTFQKPAQLHFQHEVLTELGYRFSTSTLPIYAYRFGPAFRQFGLIELPLSGMGSMPLRILDSWTCFDAPGRRFEPDDYAREGRAAADNFSALGVGLLNYYVDPAHISRRSEFFDTVAYWAERVKPVTYNKLLEELV
jgi:hypothetical protein